MNREELLLKLKDLGVLPTFYSLDGLLLTDRTVISQTGNNWSVFYFDERGNKNDEKVYSTEREAFDDLYNRFLEEKRLMGPYEDRIKAAEEFRASQKDS